MNVNWFENRIIDSLRNYHGYSKREAESEIYDIRETIFGDSYTQISPVHVISETGHHTEEFPYIRDFMMAWEDGTLKEFMDDFYDGDLDEDREPAKKSVFDLPSREPVWQNGEPRKTFVKRWRAENPLGIYEINYVTNTHTLITPKTEKDDEILKEFAKEYKLLFNPFAETKEKNFTEIPTENSPFSALANYKYTIERTNPFALIDALQDRGMSFTVKVDDSPDFEVIRNGPRIDVSKKPEPIQQPVQSQKNDFYSVSASAKQEFLENFKDGMIIKLSPETLEYAKKHVYSHEFEIADDYIIAKQNKLRNTINRNKLHFKTATQYENQVKNKIINEIENARLAAIERENKKREEELAKQKAAEEKAKKFVEEHPIENKMINVISLYKDDVCHEYDSDLFDNISENYNFIFSTLIKKYNELAEEEASELEEDFADIYPNGYYYSPETPENENNYYFLGTISTAQTCTKIVGKTIGLVDFYAKEINNKMNIFQAVVDKTAYDDYTACLDTVRVFGLSKENALDIADISILAAKININDIKFVSTEEYKKILENIVENKNINYEGVIKTTDTISGPLPIRNEIKTSVDGKSDTEQKFLIVPDNMPLKEILSNLEEMTKEEVKKESMLWAKTVILLPECLKFVNKEELENKTEILSVRRAEDSEHSKASFTLDANTGVLSCYLKDEAGKIEKKAEINISENDKETVEKVLINFCIENNVSLKRSVLNEKYSDYIESIKQAQPTI